MKKISLFVFILSLFILPPAWAMEGSVEGSIQGLTCVTQGKLCPVGKEDPMAAIEKIFVVLTPKKDYYFVPNVDRAVLARHINDRVRVTGKLHPRYPSIEAAQIEVFTNGIWKITWKYSLQEELEKSLQDISAM